MHGEDTSAAFLPQRIGVDSAETARNFRTMEGAASRPQQ